MRSPVVETISHDEAASRLQAIADDHAAGRIDDATMQQRIDQVVERIAAPARAAARAAIDVTDPRD